MQSGDTKGGSNTVPLTSCLTGLDLSVLQISTKIVSCHTADTKRVKQEVNGTVILPPLVFPGSMENCKQNARWQHVSQLKASAFFSLKKKTLVVKKHYNLYLGLVTPSNG